MHASCEDELTFGGREDGEERKEESFLLPLQPHLGWEDGGRQSRCAVMNPSPCV